MKRQRALVSVSDKTEVVSFCRGLADCGIEIISTGGTAKLLRGHGLAVRDVSEITEFPEILDGRVKTLHPRVHGGILARRSNHTDREQMESHGITGIDLVAVNLYPFEDVVAKGASFEEAIENIDIGGPTMIRAAAKNWQDVAVVVDHTDYPSVLEALRERGTLDDDFRKELARKAFRRTARYDAAISQWWQDQGSGPNTAEDLLRPWHGDVRGLRYGENPHQKACVIVAPETSRVGAAHAELLWGKELSYNNLLDVDAAFELVRDLPRPSVAIIKHTNPCGAALGGSACDAFTRAYEADPRSAFGGIVAFNTGVDADTAREIADRNKFLEVLIAPSFDEDALDILKKGPKWCQKLRVLCAGAIAETAGDESSRTRWQLRSLGGALLCQEYDGGVDSLDNVVTERRPDSSELESLELAWRIVRHVKSNAIVLVRDGVLVGAGAGQMSRVEAVALSIERARDRAEGAALGSDAFFPFPDGVEAAADAGVRSVIQPGGSIKDPEVIDAANRRELAMILTGRRHFRH